MDQMKLLLGLSVLPALLLMMYIRSKDKIEKEPFGLLAKLFALGAATTISAAIVETVANALLSEVLDSATLPFIMIENFLIVALAEEGGKLFVLKKATWRSPEFDYTFDAVVYSVAVSLGFATLENVVYVVSSGTIGLAVMRGILSVPGHAIDGVYMGYFYGLAKRAEARGDDVLRRSSMLRALFVPVLIHGFYDFCLSLESDIMLLVFVAFEILITVLAVRKVNKLSREDTRIFPESAATFTRMHQMYGSPYQGFPNFGGYQNYQNYQNYNGFGGYQPPPYQGWQPPPYQGYQSYQNSQNYQNYHQGYGGSPYSSPYQSPPNGQPRTYGNNEYYQQEQKQKNFWEE